jgi:hypothetical protein
LAVGNVSLTRLASARRARTLDQVFNPGPRKHGLTVGAALPWPHETPP